mmetsp:Transcript_64450/g.185232  ORF Transcript_64450/g.185232 Transcript_64450/m.185232 type:complete len:211 (+) Transcript_64450:1563-2195(+)
MQKFMEQLFPLNRPNVGDGRVRIQQRARCLRVPGVRGAAHRHQGDDGRPATGPRARQQRPNARVQVLDPLLRQPQTDGPNLVGIKMREHLQQRRQVRVVEVPVPTAGLRSASARERCARAIGDKSANGQVGYQAGVGHFAACHGALRTASPEPLLDARPLVREAICCEHGVCEDGVGDWANALRQRPGLRPRWARCGRRRCGGRRRRGGR